MKECGLNRSQWLSAELAAVFTHQLRTDLPLGLTIRNMSAHSMISQVA
tara:strand:+ start:1234 stop:1377 length:144 start_codon:yes stop_codon:yes gene_type:complete